MEWYYAEGTEQRGPVRDEEFQQLVSAGTVTSATLVWREGMSNWKPYGEAVTSAPASGGLVCVECGRAFTAEQVIRYGDQWVCGSCKPLLLQRMREGAAPVTQTGQLTSDQLVERDYTVDVQGAIRQAWEVLMASFGLLLGGALLAYLVLLAVGLVPIPILNTIASMVLSGPIMGGVWLLFIRKVRREDARAGDVFVGFGPRFGQLALAYLASSLLAGLCLGPALAPVGFYVAQAAAQQGVGSLPAPGTLLIVVFAVLAVVGFCGFAYLTVSWFFALPLVMDKNLGFWEAMQLSRRVVARHWWRTLWLCFVVWLLTLLGALACLVGLLVTGPLAVAALSVHYQRVFGDLQEKAS